MGTIFKKEPIEPKDWGPTTGIYQGEREGNPNLDERALNEVRRQRVRSELMISNLIDASRIEVGAEGSKIILDGTVPDLEMITAAVALASGVEGVTEVVNQLSVAAKPAA